MSDAKKAVKSYGFKDVAEPAKMIDKHYTTITRWHKSNPVLFKAVMIGLKQIKEESK